MNKVRRVICGKINLGIMENDYVSTRCCRTGVVEWETVTQWEIELKEKQNGVAWEVRNQKSFIVIERGDLKMMSEKSWGKDSLRCHPQKKEREKKWRHSGSSI